MSFDMSKIPIDEKTGLPTLEDGYGLTKSERTKSSAIKKNIFSTKRSFLVNFFILWVVLGIFDAFAYMIDPTLFSYGILGILIYFGIKFYQIPRMKIPKSSNNRNNINWVKYSGKNDFCGIDGNGEIYNPRTGLTIGGRLAK